MLYDPEARGHCYKLFKKMCKTTITLVIRVIETWNKMPCSRVKFKFIEQFQIGSPTQLPETNQNFSPQSMSNLCEALHAYLLTQYQGIK
jgi:hypothetical protein